MVTRAYPSAGSDAVRTRRRRAARRWLKIPSRLGFVVAVLLATGAMERSSAVERAGHAATALPTSSGTRHVQNFSPAAAVPQIKPPLGPHINLTEADFAGSSSFSTNDPVVVTSYFYWYDNASKAHIVDGDGSDALTDHPPTLSGFSYKSTAWHKSQLADMIDAGVDVLLPVYWGAPSERNATASSHYWSFAGLGPLVSAREEAVREGKAAPRIGMFYDTSTLQYNSWNRHIDLTTDYGREWFYESIRDFFSLIAPTHWAMVNGQPLVFLYSASFAVKHDQSCIDFVRESFARDFGGRTPYIVREISWQVRSENVYAWGGALGLKNPGVASLGPGYNDSAVPGRTPLIVAREDGALFERNWVRFLRNPSKIVAIETWNEFHEATEIADSKEYGRAYIELNRNYADLFRQGVVPPLPRGRYSDAKSVAVRLREVNVEEGLVQFEHADGVTAPATVGGSECRGIVPTQFAGRYIYFRIDDSFKWAASMQANVEVEYFDSLGGKFTLEFDGSDRSAPFQGAYTRSSTSFNLTGTQLWKTGKFSLAGARFLNSQNGGADFRLAISASEFYVRRVKIIRPGVPEEAGQVVHGYQDGFTGPRSANWVVHGPGGDLFGQASGLLQIRSSPGPASRLLLAIGGGSNSAQEVLARVRVTRLGRADALLGGLAVAVDTNTPSGFDYSFGVTNGGVRQMAFSELVLGPGPRASMAWATNTWYWLRLKHEPSGLADFPDVWAKTWRADGVTPEPAAWLLVWNYFPAQSARTGLAGFTAGSSREEAALEFDYFLLKAEGLPAITVALPELKPARCTLVAGQPPTSGTFSFQVTGEAGRVYRVEASANLVDWVSVGTVSIIGGAAQFNDSSAATLAHRFYRTRLLP